MSSIDLRQTLEGLETAEEVARRLRLLAERIEQEELARPVQNGWLVLVDEEIDGKAIQRAQHQLSA